MRIMSLLKGVSFLMLFSSMTALGLECAHSVERLEQLTHVSSGGQTGPLRDRILGRFKSSKGFYVYEYKSQLYLGIDGGFLLGKRSYALTVCPKEDGWLLIRADLEGKKQTVNARMLRKSGKAALELAGGQGRLAGFNGLYLRQNMSMQDILDMFVH